VADRHSSTPTSLRLLVPLVAVVTAAVVACSSPHKDGALAQSGTPAAPVSSPAVVRPDAATLPAEDRTAFVAAVKALDASPSPWHEGLSAYDSFVRLFSEAHACEHAVAFGQPGWLPWNRGLLLAFERALSASAGRRVVVPYWDWADADAAAAIFAEDFMGGDGADGAGTLRSGPFASPDWSVWRPDADPDPVVRGFGTDPQAPELPVGADVDAALGAPAFDDLPYSPASAPERSFRNALEGWRDAAGAGCDGEVMVVAQPRDVEVAMARRALQWVAGERADRKRKVTRGTLAGRYAPGDPVYWLWAANVDRLWAQWEQSHTESYAPASAVHNAAGAGDRLYGLDVLGVPARASDLLSTEALGYRYG